MSSTFPVWLVILLFGCVFIFFVGFFNQYIPKSQKKIAKRYRENPIGEPPIIIAELRFDRIVYLVLAIMIVVLSTVLFSLREYFTMVDYLGDNVFGYSFAIVLVVAAVFFLILFFFIVALLGETVSLNDKIKHYVSYYHVDVMSDK